MADDRRDDEIRDARVDDEPRAGVADAPRRKRKRWGLRLLLFLVVLPLLLVAGWTAITLNYTYSTGDRAGYVQKFSKKGWLCKTWEGEIAMVTMPGTMPQIFPFTVRDDSVAKEIERLLGRRVSLTYEEHPGVPFTCFGETKYFVNSVRAIGGPD
jgi:hypothetical protein